MNKIDKYIRICEFVKVYPNVIPLNKVARGCGIPVNQIYKLIDCIPTLSPILLGQDDDGCLFYNDENAKIKTLKYLYELKEQSIDITTLCDV